MSEFRLRLPASTGGKAGKGHNKTSSVQVIEAFSRGSFLLRKNIRYKVGDLESKQMAIEEGLAVIRELKGQQNNELEK